MLLLMCDGEEASGIIIWGERAQSGAYVLRICVEEPRTVSFGRYGGGRPISVPAGHVLYVGSAMGSRGSTTLARRLLRHTTRSGGRPPHPMRALLLRRFRQVGLGPDDLHPPTAKRLHWHVDYLLEEPAVTVDAVLAIRSSRRYEGLLADLLARSPHTEKIVAGLGATDVPGRTHLMRLDGGKGAWRDVLKMLRDEILNEQDDANPGRQHQ